MAKMKNNTHEAAETLTGHGGEDQVDLMEYIYESSADSGTEAMEGGDGRPETPEAELEERPDTPRETDIGDKTEYLGQPEDGHIHPAAHIPGPGMEPSHTVCSEDRGAPTLMGNGPDGHKGGDASNDTTRPQSAPDRPIAGTLEEDVMVEADNTSGSPEPEYCGQTVSGPESGSYPPYRINTTPDSPAMRAIALPVEDFRSIVGISLSTAYTWMEKNKVGKAQIMGKTYVWITEKHDKYRLTQESLAIESRDHGYKVVLEFEGYCLKARYTASTNKTKNKGSNK